MRLHLLQNCISAWLEGQTSSHGWNRPVCTVWAVPFNAGVSSGISSPSQQNQSSFSPAMRYLWQTVPGHLNTHTTPQFLSKTPLEESCNCLYCPQGLRFRLLPSTSFCTPSQKESSHESREDSLCSILAHLLPSQRHFISTLTCCWVCCHTQLSPWLTWEIRGMMVFPAWPPITGTVTRAGSKPWRKHKTFQLLKHTGKKNKRLHSLSWISGHTGQEFQRQLLSRDKATSTEQNSGLLWSLHTVTRYYYCRAG